MNELYVRNRQKVRQLNLPLFKKITTELLLRLCPSRFRVGILIVGDSEMTRLNEEFLHHAGSTDVISFGYSSGAEGLHGEIFICIDEAIRQATRFRTTWQQELVRYVAHGLLHFQGHSDHTKPARRRMKIAENALVQQMTKQFSLSQLLRKPRVHA